MGLIEGPTEWEGLDLEGRLPWILALLVHEHPAQELLNRCDPGIYVRILDGGLVEAYALMDEIDGAEVVIGRFPPSMMLRQDVNHPQSLN